MKKLKKLIIILLILGIIFISGCTKKETLKNICHEKRYYDGSLISIFVDKEISAHIEEEIQRFREDIEYDLNTDTVVYSIDSNTQPSYIRNILIEDYESKDLIGSIFIGSIPLVYTETPRSQNEKLLALDYYKMLDSEFKDLDKNGLFEIYPGSLYEKSSGERKIWLGLLIPPTEDKAEKISLLKDYFSRNHNYRKGMTNFNRKILTFDPITWSQCIGKTEEEHTLSIKNSVDRSQRWDSDSVSVISFKDTNKAGNSYIQELQKPYEFVFVFAHGTPYSHNPSISSEKIKEVKPKPLFYDIRGCLVGKFDEQKYLAGTYLFYGDAITISAPVTKIISECPKGFWEGVSTRLLNDGMLFGEVYGDVFGDPTLRLFNERYPCVEVEYNKSYDFGKIKPSMTGEKEVNIYVKNIGEDDLIIQAVHLPPDLQLSYRIPDLPVTVAPGSSIKMDLILFNFNVRYQKDEVEGNIIFETNRPFEPVITVQIKYFVEPTQLEIDEKSCFSNKVLCDIKNQITFYAGDCNLITGDALCHNNKCVKAFFYKVNGEDPQYIDYTLGDKTEVDCGKTYEGKERMFYVEAECCSMNPVS